MECVRSVRRVEANLGIVVDPNEKFNESLAEKLADAAIAKVDNEIIRQAKEQGVM